MTATNNVVSMSAWAQERRVQENAWRHGVTPEVAAERERIRKMLSTPLMNEREAYLDDLHGERALVNKRARQQRRAARMHKARVYVPGR